MKNISDAAKEVQDFQSFEILEDEETGLQYAIAKASTGRVTFITEGPTGILRRGFMPPEDPAEYQHKVAKTVRDLASLAEEETIDA